ncbi:MAG: hypothetical protein J07HX64_02720 [halophilic archaeon J07HX64]|jgi:hypothetical protein|nr:MAG: hypothetical protein J07HX64_02720 [halophilic archaeon J07HX64]
MDRIQDGRRDIMIHGNASFEDLPIDGLSEDELKVAGAERFVPYQMSGPKIYPGDVLVGIVDGDVEFGELIYDKIDDGVLVVSLNTGEVEFISDSQFARRFYSHEIHIYDDITREAPDWDTEFKQSEIERPEISRAR